MAEMKELMACTTSKIVYAKASCIAILWMKVSTLKSKAV